MRESEGDMRWSCQFGDPQIGNDLGSDQKAIRALGLVPIAAFYNYFSSFGSGNILPKGPAHRPFLPDKPLPLKCEYGCDSFQRRTEVQGNLGHMNTWDLCLSAALPRARFMGTWKQRDLFPCKHLFFSHFVTQSCSPPGFNKPFQDFSPCTF